MNRSRSVTLMLFLGLASLLGPGLASAASPGISCRYVEAGPPGPAGNRLAIRVTRPEEVVAIRPDKGKSIVVADDQRMRSIRCKGRKPTMLNIDRVVFTAGRRADYSSLYIAEAPKFGPGATPAEAGGKGISFVAKGPALSFGVGGTDGPDQIRMGMAGKAAALDFSPDNYFDGEAGDDIDARVFARKSMTILVKAGNGADTVAASQFDTAGTWFDGPLTVPTSIYGEGGPDALAGGRAMDYLDGGPGNDILTGAAGADQLYGGPGKDIFSGGPGRDEIDAIDRRPGEAIDCGAGRDLASMDLKDQDQNCELFRFP